ncbi:MAG: fructosamine kinase family protein [Betaproteobacteria bacterium]|nr:fructosamine kinase family protein [Betaproteobacteria bacterium]
MTLRAELAAAIGRAIGAPFEAGAARSVHGGDISDAFTLGDGDRTFFVKVQPAARLDLFEAEAAGLAELAAAHAVRVPRVVCHGTAAGRAYLVLEHLPLGARGDAARLGRQLAQQHRAGAEQFGWTRDNWIGATPQPNAWHEGWIDFWRAERLGFQLRLAAENGYGALQRDGDSLLAHLAAFFDGYAPVPSLLHGDLWGGNHGYLADGTPVIFDPAPYFGDRECDLAMSELFGGFAPDFHAAYREAWPLDAGYAVRKTLYNLYHILNHANLFGGGYAAQAQRMLAQLLSQVR